MSPKSDEQKVLEERLAATAIPEIEVSVLGASPAGRSAGRRAVCLEKRAWRPRRARAGMLTAAAPRWG